MITKFRKNHILKFFYSYDNNRKIPLDLALNQYLKANKSIGSNDRKIISDSIFSIIRWLELIDANIEKPITWEKRLEKFISEPIKELSCNPNIAMYQKVSFPNELFTLLVDSLGTELAIKFCNTSNTIAPTYIRVNLLKTTREALFRGWKDKYDISLCSHSEEGIKFHKKINLVGLSEFKKGLFEIQDEASQIISNMVNATPGDEVLDYCAGAGGKSLAIAAKMQNKGQIFLHDIRQRALISAKKRLKRAGAQNTQFIYDNPKQFKRMKKRTNWIIVDVPCSGSGTWRRNPDQKWKFTKADLHNLIEEQRTIFENALEYLHPKGTIVYSTCSVFPQENEDQIKYFMEKFNLKLNSPPFHSFPEIGEMDGFFGAALSQQEADV